MVILVKRGFYVFNWLLFYHFWPYLLNFFHTTFKIWRKPLNILFWFLIWNFLSIRVIFLKFHAINILKLIFLVRWNIFHRFCRKSDDFIFVLLVLFNVILSILAEDKSFFDPLICFCFLCLLLNLIFYFLESRPGILYKVH